jgi:hypothetical protein
MPDVLIIDFIIGMVSSGPGVFLNTPPNEPTAVLIGATKTISFAAILITSSIPYPY